MSKTIQISRDIKLPVELTTRRSAIFGISGSGKSNTATVCIEGLLEAGEQIVLVDPKGEGWGLQTSADGKKPGFDVIVFGKPRGDIPELRVEHAEQVADFIVDSGRSVVLSLLGFETDQDERKFVIAFFKRLYRRKSQMPVKTRTLVVLEEAHLFVPEQASGANGEMVGAIKRIGRQGRSAGLGLMIVDQRPQEVAKSIISQSELLICHQLVHKLDRDALNDWVRAYDVEGQGATFLASLAELAPGEAWAWSPAWLHIFERTKINRRQTYDSGATPDGSAAAAPKAKATVDLDKLRTHLSKVVEEAKANDPAELKKQLVAANAELAKLKHAAPAPAKVEQKTVEKPVISDKQLERLEAIATRAGDRITAFNEKFTDLVNPMMKLLHDEQTLANQLLTAARAVKNLPPPSIRPVVSGVARVAPAAPAPRPARAPVDPETKADGKVKLEKMHRAFLAALSQFPEGLKVDKLCVIAGYSYGGSVRTALSALRSGGLIIGGNTETMQITELGMEYGPFPALPEGKELIAHWMKHSSMEKMHRAFLSAFLRYPGGLTSSELCDVADYEWGGSVRTALSTMRTIGVIKGKNTETMKASDELLAAAGPHWSEADAA
ncbi:MAG: ATP-binding protein [Phycisphaerae bacterium]|nr:ATP-binding protein [Phycisphaerae bacterium]